MSTRDIRVDPEQNKQYFAAWLESNKNSVYTTERLIGAMDTASDYRTAKMNAVKSLWAIADQSEFEEACRSLDTSDFIRDYQILYFPFLTVSNCYLKWLSSKKFESLISKHNIDFVTSLASAENTHDDKKTKEDVLIGQNIDSVRDGDPKSGVVADVNDEELYAFQEEQRNLNKIENRIQQMISTEEKAAEKLFSEAYNAPSYDYEDIGNRGYLYRQSKRKENEAARYEAYIDSPYFGHFDLSFNDNVKEYFIGENILRDRDKPSEVIILDWRDPIGGQFYNKSEHSFTVDDVDYELLLRRSVEIKNATLLSVNTEYDTGTLSLVGDVIDPFLLSALRDKRRNHKLTDIIRTIQENQNRIIRKPLETGFAVQGCAGSGKTMILLHRLSYIAYNYPDVDFSRFFVLTPSESFNIHIDELSEHLGIDKVRKYTVEEFYSYLIGLRANRDTIVVNNQNVSKFSAPAVRTVSESKLDKGVLTKLYSEEFQDEICREYSGKERESVDRLNQLGIVDVLGKYGRSVRTINDLSYESFARIYPYLDQIITKHDTASSAIDAARNEETAAKQLLTELNNRTASEEERFNKIRNDLLVLCKNRIRELDEETEENRNLYLAQNDRLSELSLEEESINEQREKEERIIQSDFSGRTGIETLFGLLDSGNYPELNDYCADEYNSIFDLRRQLGSLAPYNFVRRNQLNQRLREAENGLRDKAAEWKTKVNVTFSESIAAIMARLEETEKEKNDANTELEKLSEEENTRRNLKNAYAAVRGLIETRKEAEIRRSVSTELVSLVADDIVDPYEAALQRYRTFIREIRTAEDALLHREEELAVIEKDLVDFQDIDVMRESMSVLKEFDIRQLSRWIESKVEEIYTEFDVECPSNKGYRYEFYLKLLLASLYYGPMPNLSYMLSVDEAQDISLAEYKLLKRILGERTTFNLYGDVNQLIYDYKGIYDWSLLSDLIGDEVLLLNENYRNTIQITEYCNEIFGADVTAVGITGPDVQIEDIDSSVEEMIRYRRTNPGSRAAIIVKDKKQELTDAFFGTAVGKELSLEVDASRISLITAEEAKGLEFDAVLVVDDGMLFNEKYLSYTRALDELIVSSIAS